LTLGLAIATIVSGLFGFAYGFGLMFQLFRWIMLPVYAPLVTLLVLFFLLSMFRNWRLLLPILLLVIIYLGYFQIRRTGFRVYYYVNRSELEGAAATFKANPGIGDFWFTIVEMQKDSAQTRFYYESRAQIESTGAHLVIKDGNSVMFLLDSFINWHTGIIYSLDGIPPKESGEYYHQIWVTPLEGNWSLYYAAD
jgi:hypothetical protein